MSIKYIIFTIVFINFIGCTINGKKLDEVMDKNTSKTTTKTKSSADTNKSSSFPIHFKWANKEYHNGEEDINFHINTK